MARGRTAGALAVGVAAAIGAVVVWAVELTMIASQVRRLDSLSINAIRMVLAALFFVVLLYPLGAERDLTAMSGGEMAALIISGLIALAAGDTLYIAGIAMVGVNRSYTVGVALYTLFSFVLSVIFLDETAAWETAAGAALVLTGIYIVLVYGRASHDPAESALAASAGGVSVVADDGAGRPPPPAGQAIRRFPLLGAVRPSARLGFTLVSVSALLWAISTVWLRDAGEGFNAAAIGFVRLPSAALLLGAVALLQPRTALRRREVSRRSVAVLVVGGLIGSGFGSLLFTFAVLEIGAGKTAVLSSASPLFALPLAALFLRERITIWMAGGTLLAVLGIILLV